MFLIFIAGLLWGTIGIFVKELNSLGADSALTCFIRMLFAFLIMSSAALAKHGKKFFAIDSKTLLLCAGLGLVSQGFFNICYTASIKLNGMGMACVLMYSAPVFTAIASRIFFHEKISKLKIFALALNILGCVLTITGGNIFNNSQISLLGMLAGIGTGFCYGMAAIFGTAAGEKTDALTMSAYSYLFATIFLFMLNNPGFENLDAKILGVGFLYGLLPTSLAYMVYYIGLTKVRDTSRVPVIASIEPIAAVLLGMLIYNEQLRATNFIGVAVVFLSIVIMMKAK
ncbi:MAG: EamA family transporter [Synergistaceae bacterium]|nr:EamA family transporter [Synergistaceae bacterium]